MDVNLKQYYYLKSQNIKPSLLLRASCKSRCIAKSFVCRYKGCGEA
jgi:hypothetical protein